MLVSLLGRFCTFALSFQWPLVKGLLCKRKYCKRNYCEKPDFLWWEISTQLSIEWAKHKPGSFPAATPASNRGESHRTQGCPTAEGNLSQSIGMLQIWPDGNCTCIAWTIKHATQHTTIRPPKTLPILHSSCCTGIISGRDQVCFSTADLTICLSWPWGQRPVGVKMSDCLTFPTQAWCFALSWLLCVQSESF